jgi:transcriptional regulator with XRE-family HTH domain
MHQEEVIEQLKRRREILGVTQRHLSEMSGISLRALAALESGKSNPTLETLSKLAEVLGMELKLELKHPKL